MKFEIRIQCACGNQETIEIKRYIDDEFSLQDSINESVYFKADQSYPDAIMVECDCGKREILGT
ncbi:hypothetical protein [Cytobacillus gottheilii]|uniref:hypothetical protein n=1 Tax=Cytobacillus gottheilii TaxID=859144 RepID=UPI0009BC567D|nr:hypothetical protein [Cytobacillus gottheilii]